VSTLRSRETCGRLTALPNLNPEAQEFVSGDLRGELDV
jgi:hypothetical protein